MNKAQGCGGIANELSKYAKEFEIPWCHRLHNLEWGNKKHHRTGETHQLLQSRREKMTIKGAETNIETSHY